MTHMSEGPSQIVLFQCLLRWAETYLVMIQQQNLPGMVCGRMPVMGHHDYGCTMIYLVFLQQILKVGLSDLIHSGGRFIQ